MRVTRAPLSGVKISEEKDATRGVDRLDGLLGTSSSSSQVISVRLPCALVAGLTARTFAGR